jgi:CAAX protease family protein
MKNFGNAGNVLIALVAALGIPQMAGGLTTYVAVHFGHSLDKIDPNGACVWNSIHHLSQLLFTVILMLWLNRSLRVWGFNLDHWKRSLLLFWRFFLYFTGFILVLHALLFFFVPPPSFPHPLTARNLIGELGFKLLLSGTAEEPLFRGLVMVLLYQSMNGIFRLGGLEMPHAGAVAAVIFMAAHIGFTLWPLAIAWISIPQLLEAFGMGLFYAYLFHQTRSLLGPMLAHNYFNFSLTAVGMAWALLKQ